MCNSWYGPLAFLLNFHTSEFCENDWVMLTIKRLMVQKSTVDFFKWIDLYVCACTHTYACHGIGVEAEDNVQESVLSIYRVVLEFQPGCQACQILTRRTISLAQDT